MSHKPKKRCNPQELDCTYNLNLYFSDKEDAVFREDFLKFPMKVLHDVFSKGVIHGNIMIDMSMSSFIHYLYSASDVFKDIIIMKFSNNCIMEVRKRLDDQTGANASAVGELEAKSDQKLKLKASIKQIVKGNLNEENLTHPLELPLADSVMSAGLLDIISKDVHDFVKNLKKVAQLLKSRGRFIMMGLFNNTFITVGSDQFHWLKYDESFVRSSLSKAGFVTDDCLVQKRTNVSDLADYSHVFVITAHKEK